jgi:hypothetical protein
MQVYPFVKALHLQLIDKVENTFILIKLTCRFVLESRLSTS